MPRMYSPREFAREKAKKLKFLVESIDSYRAGYFVSLQEIKKTIGDLDLENHIIDWNKVIECLNDIISIPQRDRRFNRIIRFDKVSSRLLKISFIGLVISTILIVMGQNPHITFSALLTTLLLTNISYIMRLYVSMNINKIYRERWDEVTKYDEFLRKIVNVLLARLRGELKKTGIDISRVKIKLYHRDYDGIKVLKEPRKRGGYYTVTLAR